MRSRKLTVFGRIEAGSRVTSAGSRRALVSSVQPLSSLQSSRAKLRQIGHSKVLKTGSQQSRTTLNTGPLLGAKCRTMLFRSICVYGVTAMGSFMSGPVIINKVASQMNL